MAGRNLIKWKARLDIKTKGGRTFKRCTLRLVIYFRERCCYIADRVRPTHGSGHKIHRHLYFLYRFFSCIQSMVPRTTCPCSCWLVPPPSIDLRPFVGNTVPIEGKKCAHTHTSTKKIISRTIQLGTGRPSTVGRSWNSDRISFSLVVIFGKFLVGSVGISFVRFPSLLLLPHFVL